MKTVQATKASSAPAGRTGSSRSRRVPAQDIVRPLVTVDVAIFCIREDELCVLLVQRPQDPVEPFPGRWALPGGFVDVEQDASIEDCARRKLLEKTGVATPYLEQLGSWGGANRDPRGWSVTNVYFALVIDPGLPDSVGASPQRWFPVRGRALPRPLAFDHDRLLDAAIKRLRDKVEYTVLPASLLPLEFTLPQLQRSFEIVLGRELDKSAFRTRMLTSGVIEDTGRMQPSSRRPAALYRLTDSPAHTLPGTFRRGDSTKEG